MLEMRQRRGSCLPGFPCAVLDEGSAAAPVAGHRLGVQGGQDVVALCTPQQYVARQPYLVPYFQPTTGAYRVRPLPRDNLTAGPWKRKQCPQLQLQRLLGSGTSKEEQPGLSAHL